MPKIKEKRVSGTGYTKAEASQLLYKRQDPDGTYEIDIDTINDIVEAYTEREHRKGIKQINTAKSSYGVEWIEPISRPGLQAALKIKSRSTYDLWREGFVNEEHKDPNSGYRYNKALSDAICAGENSINQYNIEDADSNRSSIIIEALRANGEFPANKTVDINFRAGKLPKSKTWRNYGK